MDRRRRWLALIATLLVVGAGAALDGVVASSGAWAANTSARHHPSPTPIPPPTPTPTPTRPTPPPPTPTPLPTQPPPTPSVVATAPPTPPPTVAATDSSAPSLAPSAAAGQAINGLPSTGPPAGTGQAQAVAIAAAPQADNAADSGPNDTQSLLWSIVLVAIAIPGFLLMTLIATVLIRR